MEPIPNCWEFKGCGCERSRACPAVTKSQGRMCWLVAGTLCDGEVQGTFARKYKSCRECDFYVLATSPEMPHGAA